MKKKLSISFVALAVAMLMVLNIVPHHHHDSVPCMLVERCEADHSANDEHTGHRGGKDMTHGSECMGEAFYYTPEKNDQEKSIVSPCDHSGNHDFPFLIYSLFADFLTFTDKTITAPPEYGEYISFYTSAEASGFNGLRAPPSLT